MPWAGIGNPVGVFNLARCARTGTNDESDLPEPADNQDAIAGELIGWLPSLHIAVRPVHFGFMTYCHFCESFREVNFPP
jgi:hypothetical protein